LLAVGLDLSRAVLEVRRGVLQEDSPVIEERAKAIDVAELAQDPTQHQAVESREGPDDLLTES